MRLTGAHSSISDLTPAAGWTVLDCDEINDLLNIRVACHDPTKGCDHLYLNGAEHTIVRLPEECGPAPFALVLSERDHENQSIPLSKRSLFARRYSAAPTVKHLAATTTLLNADPSRHGNVTLLIRGSARTATDAYGAQKSTQQNIKARSWFGNPFQVSQKTIHSNDTSPYSINLNGTRSIYSYSKDCPPQGNIPAYSGTVDVTATGSFKGSILLEYNITYQLLPPAIETLELSSELNATMEGVLEIDANLAANFSTGRVELLSVPIIPGLGIPGIVAIGPIFALYAEADIDVGANANVAIGLSFTANSTELSLPPSSNSTNGFTLGDPSIDLSASADVLTQARIGVYLIPALEIGLDLFKGSFKTAVDIEMDASAELILNLTAGAEASIATDNDNSTDVTTGTHWGGCVDLTADLTVAASADADIAGLLDGDKSLPLYDYSRDLYSKCYGSGNFGKTQRRAHIDTGADALAAYQNRLIHKYAANPTAAVERFEFTNLAASSPSASDKFRCISSGPSGVVPISRGKKTSNTSGK